MRRLPAMLLALATSGTAPAAAQEPQPTWQEAAAADAARGQRVRAALAASGFRGVYAVSANGRRIAGGVVGDDLPYEAILPLPGLSRQVASALLMQRVEQGRLDLAAPVSRYLAVPGGGALTLGQVAEHRSGLGDATAGGAAGCLRAARRGTAGGAWRYAACDYSVVLAVVAREAERPVPALYAERLAGPAGSGALFLSGPDGRADAAWPGAPTPAELSEVARGEPAGLMVGTAEDVLALDGALMDGRLLAERSLARLWRPRESLFQPLGQWSFRARPAGCAAAVGVVERPGRAGRFSMTNALVPERGLAMVLVSATEGAGAGEVRDGRGAAFQALGAALC